jgi:peptide/nickel transport system permease protein
MPEEATKITNLISTLAIVRKSMRGIPKVPLVILLTLFTVAIFADILALHDPEYGNPRERMMAPFWMEGGSVTYPLGTDTMGRCILTRLIYGARISLVVAFMGVFFSAVIGLFFGVAGGYFGGWVDQATMRLLDAKLCIPTVMLGILFSLVLGPSVGNIVLIVSISYWTRYARVIRGEVLSLRTREFVQLAKVAGAGNWRIILDHIVPNVMNTIITIASLQIGVVIVVEASLTFLGVGVPPPKPAWGLMLSEGRAGLFTGYWWLIFFPGACIGMLVMSFNLIGDWLRRQLDPHFRNL